ncbi:ABC transporter permease [Enterococcus phoeniculicola]|jgi:putative aldouronate transport system permease protein|uniref:ABC transporter permease n=1 Tax=Enterococcus phoeniculicola ATCC BAA-412 TaxID=1158610 RepID=R3W3C3_9ENTE|nr:carbohydrate ABC transporter permease [Enterococcus phoeniculicola]EOL41946.1 ABC transporter permease [Enterococcus phoeniculicola ATCC BAA-412]EOT79775.1 ABC transporter permease [Enterococcus phoeniculicola ATCC BAA-412]OJG70096.1 ABC transporter permease [Enterococcus phoeniculicola]
MIKRASKENGKFYFFNTLILILFSLLIIVPVWNILVSSVSSSSGLAENGLVLWPRGFTLENYRRVLSDASIPRAFGISVLKTVIGAATHTLFCAVVAYGLSKSRLMGRSIYTTLGVITMYFGGGMIPTYLLIKSLGLLDTFWVYIIPALFSYYDVVILMNFFREIPASLEESAKIDGASEFQIFYKIFLPLTKPALATIVLFNGVGQWNDFMTTKLYITKEYLYPLQMKIYEIIVQSNLSTMTESGSTDVIFQATTRGVQLATIVITTVPILIIYPLLQKHFIGGMMAGAVKE